MRGRRRRGAPRPREGAPSDQATERLRQSVRREVADLRLRLEEASLRGDAYLQAGYPAEAAEVADEQRQLLSRFESQLRRSVSEAAVEAEAERILAAVPGAEALSGTPAHETDRTRARSSPAMISALVAALLALVAVSGPGPEGAQLSSAESPPPGAEPDVAALPSAAVTTPAATPRDPNLVVPTPSALPSDVRHGDGDLPDAPDASPTERLADFVEGLVDVAEDVVRDAMRVLLDQGREAITAEPVFDGAPGITPSGPPADAAGEQGPAASEDPEESASEDGSLSGATPPLDVDDGDPESDQG